MSDSLEETKAALARQRVQLLRRETANLRSARAILEELEAAAETDPRMLAHSRRAVELATQAQRLGIVDAHRVGAAPADLAAAAGMDVGAVEDILARRA